MIVSRSTRCGGRKFVLTCRGVLIRVVFLVELDGLDG
jgi:hypothetical protein